MAGGGALAALRLWHLRLSRALAVAGLGLLLALAVLTLADASLRYVAAMPIDAVRDLGSPLSAVAVACCLPVAVMERSHIAVLAATSAFGHRTGRWFDAFADAVVLATLVVIGIQLLRYAADSARNGDASWMLGVPMAPFWYAVAALAWASASCQVVTFGAGVRRGHGAAPGAR